MTCGERERRGDQLQAGIDVAAGRNPTGTRKGKPPCRRISVDAARWARARLLPRAVSCAVHAPRGVGGWAVSLPPGSCEFRFPTSHTQGVRCIAWQADVVVAGLPAVWPSCPMEHGGDANSGPRPVGVSPSDPYRRGRGARHGRASRDRRRPAYRSQRGRNVLLMFPDASLMHSLKYERVRIARHSLEAS